jgi:hypothetical protein
MDEVLREIQKHAMEHLGFTVEQANSAENLDLWRGALRSTSRPSEMRTFDIRA